MRVEVSEEGPFFGDAVDIRSAIAHHALTVSTDVGDANVIAPDDENVGFLLGGKREGDKQQGDKGKSRFTETQLEHGDLRDRKSLLIRKMTERGERRHPAVLRITGPILCRSAMNVQRIVRGEGGPSQERRRGKAAPTGLGKNRNKTLGMRSFGRKKRGLRMKLEDSRVPI